MSLTKGVFSAVLPERSMAYFAFSVKTTASVRSTRRMQVCGSDSLTCLS